jgi:hypothetical protein
LRNSSHSPSKSAGTAESVSATSSANERRSTDESAKGKSGNVLRDDGSGTPASRTNGSLSERSSTTDLLEEARRDEAGGRSTHAYNISQGLDMSVMTDEIRLHYVCMACAAWRGNSLIFLLILLFRTSLDQIQTEWTADFTTDWFGWWRWISNERRVRR